MGRSWGIGGGGVNWYVKAQKRLKLKKLNKNVRSITTKRLDYELEISIE